MTSRVISWIGSIACAAFPILSPDYCNAQQAKPTIEQILQVWKNRQEKVGSARFEMSCEETIHKGSTSFLTASLRLKAGLPPDQEPNPPRDYIVTGVGSVSLEGGPKLRYSYDLQKWDPIGKKLYQQHYVDVFNGRLYKFLQTPASGQDDYPLAAVRKVKVSQSALQFPVVPLIISIRGSNPQFFNNLEQFQVTSQTVAIAGRSCLELTKGPAPSGQSGSREVLFLDPKRDFVVIKEMIIVDGQPDWQLDIDYTPDVDIGWVPHSWDYIIRAGKDHCIINSGRYKVTNYEINPSMDDKEFGISFPPNTRVHDESSGKYVVYIIKENGEKGRAIPISLAPTYEDLLTEETRINRVAVLVVWAMIFALALGGWLWLRRRRVRKNS